MSTQPAVEFDADTHTYRLNGRKLPSVTQIIGAVIPRQFNPGDWYLERGSAVHRGIQLAAAHALDWDSVDDRIKPRIEAFQTFCKETGFWPDDVERSLASSRLHYAGTIDAQLLSERAGNVVLADWKACLEPQVELQLGAYSLLLKEHDGSVVQSAVAVKLMDNGRYSCRWFQGPELRRAEQSFKGILTTFNWMQKHNIERKVA